MKVAIVTTSSPGVFQRIRETINRHPVWACMAVAALVGCLIYVTIGHRRPSIPDGDFIDENTGQTFVMSISAIPPLPGKDGKLTVVRAYYSNPTDGEPRKLLYLQKYSAQTKEYLEQYLAEHRSGQPRFPDPQTAILVRKPDPGSPWVSLETPQGRAIAPDLWR